MNATEGPAHRDPSAPPEQGASRQGMNNVLPPGKPPGSNTPQPPLANRTEQFHLSFLPIPALVLVMAAVYLTVKPSVFYDPPWLILIGNTLFVAVVSLIISCIAFKNYRATGRLQILLLGCGVLVFGIGGLLAAFVRNLPGGANLNVTIYNMGALLGAAFHFVAALLLLAGISPETGLRRRDAWLVLGYGGSLLFMALLTAASFKGLMPSFFIQGVGPTLLRQQILGTADILFVFSFLVFVATYLRNKEVFLYWYACALALTAISLTAFFIQSSVGSPIGWVGRVSQYLGGIYFLISLLAAGRTAQRRGTSLDSVLAAALSRMEEALRESEELRRAVMDNSADAIYVKDRHSRWLLANPALLRIVGKPLEEVLGKTDAEIYTDPAIGAAILVNDAQIMERGEPEAFEEKAWTPEGIRLFLSTKAPRRDAQGRVIGLIGISRDITERKRIEDALRESEERFRTLADSIPNLAWWANGDGCTTWYNRRWYEYTGTTPEQMEGWGWQSVHSPEMLPKVLERWQASVATGEPFEMEFPLRGADGRFRWFLTRVLPLRDAAGKVVRWFGTNTDVSEIREAREVLTRGKAGLEHLVAERTAKLQELVGELEHFSYTITHDMRAPLRAMKGFGELVDDLCAECEHHERREFIRKIMISAERMDALIRDALNYSQSVRQELPLEEVDTGALLRGMLDSYPELQASKARISIEGRLPVVLGNEAGMTQCFSNLLGNAVKFVKPGKMPEVRIWAEARDGWARIWVEDQGIGIPKGMLPRVFDMFSRGSKNYEGTGIGLALVRKVVHRMGGKVGVESEAGKGSRFWLELRLGEGEGNAKADA